MKYRIFEVVAGGRVGKRITELANSKAAFICELGIFFLLGIQICLNGYRHGH